MSRNAAQLFIISRRNLPPPPPSHHLPIHPPPAEQGLSARTTKTALLPNYRGAHTRGHGFLPTSTRTIPVMCSGMVSSWRIVCPPLVPPPADPPEPTWMPAVEGQACQRDAHGEANEVPCMPVSVFLFPCCTGIHADSPKSPNSSLPPLPTTCNCDPYKT